MEKYIIDLFRTINLDYSKRIGNLDIESQGEIKSTKFFPVFQNSSGANTILKPLSRTKPLLTPLFAYSEVFCSYIIRKYFNSRAPLYQLAFCQGVSKDQPKYYEKGTLVESFLKPNQKAVNLLEYFRHNPDPGVNIDNYINCCMMLYDYTPILNAVIFKDNQILGEELAECILISILIRNQNFHYENVGFIYEENQIVSLMPPFDNEFCAMFIYADDQKMHQDVMSYLDGFFEPDKSNLFTEIISLIVERYPDLSKAFVKKLEQLISDLHESSIIIRDENYIGAFSSEEWFIGKARYKSNNEELAKELEKELVRKEIDLNIFATNLRLEFIHSAKLLKQLLEYYIRFHKTYKKQ